ncbi:uncharacterized protein LOC9659691 [Selaginella moellendorffii]|uniref:uncharacterized protein LOC9659691 n=1 Tax=Selaginella moellendorffii TaxID=88036 RepID=UPI000D1C51B2|nr:uncharacterized protein LOC9659691 [Selaginella moellendorffii]|eukprot:XP_002969313.2 uncharacterized protein LOC9659691 [Selaginella moellendorffii]
MGHICLPRGRGTRGLFRVKKEQNYFTLRARNRKFQDRQDERKKAVDAMGQSEDTVVESGSHIEYSPPHPSIHNALALLQQQQQASPACSLTSACSSLSKAVNHKAEAIAEAYRTRVEAEAQAYLEAATRKAEAKSQRLQAEAERSRMHDESKAIDLRKREEQRAEQLIHNAEVKADRLLARAREEAHTIKALATEESEKVLADALTRTERLKAEIEAAKKKEIAEIIDHVQQMLVIGEIPRSEHKSVMRRVKESFSCYI